MKKLVILCTVILLVLLPAVSVIGCKAEPEPAPPAPAPTPTPSPPAPSPPPPPLTPTIESLTYTNSEYGFSLEYPKNWDVVEDYMGIAVVFMGPLVAEETYYVNISVNVEQLSKEMTLEDYVSIGELTTKRTTADYNKVDEYSTTIAGLPANVQTFTGTVKLDGEDLLLKDGGARFVKDKVGYVITYDVPAEFHDEYADRFELVISSFKLE